LIVDLHQQPPVVGVLAEIGYAIAQAGSFEQKLAALETEALRLKELSPRTDAQCVTSEKRDYRKFEKGGGRNVRF
jgi:hypothetical protein